MDTARTHCTLAALIALAVTIVACPESPESPESPEGSQSPSAAPKPSTDHTSTKTPSAEPLAAKAVPAKAAKSEPAAAAPSPKKVKAPAPAANAKVPPKAIPQKAHADSAVAAYYAAIEAFNRGDKAAFSAAHSDDYCHYNSIKTRDDVATMHAKQFTAGRRSTIRPRLRLLADRGDSKVFFQTELYTGPSGKTARYFKFVQMRRSPRAIAAGGGKTNAPWHIAALLTRKRNKCRPGALAGVDMAKVDRWKAHYAKPHADGRIPPSILPINCDPQSVGWDGDEADELTAWNGRDAFRIGCQIPVLTGWTRIAKSEDAGAGTTHVSYAYRKSGWTMTFGRQCCSSCEGSPPCEPWSTARLYPPLASATKAPTAKDCAETQACKDAGLCLPTSTGCGPTKDFAISL